MTDITGGVQPHDTTNVVERIGGRSMLKGLVVYGATLTFAGSGTDT